MKEFLVSWQENSDGDTRSGYTNYTGLMSLGLTSVEWNKTGYVALLLECLLNMKEALGLTPSTA